MNELLALLAFALSLFGVELGGTSYSNQLNDGGTVLRSEAWAGPANARFECVQSSSGSCHYRLLPPGCPIASCEASPLRQFAVDEGKTLLLAGLPEFQLDVSPFARR